MRDVVVAGHRALGDGAYVTVGEGHLQVPLPGELGGPEGRATNSAAVSSEGRVRISAVALGIGSGATSKSAMLVLPSSRAIQAAMV